jgi:hypothetical protein
MPHSNFASASAAAQPPRRGIICVQGGWRSDELFAAERYTIRYRG